MEEFEILKPKPDLKKPPKKEEEEIDSTMTRWRYCEFYPFVMSVIEQAMNKTYLPDIMREKFLAGEHMDDSEVGQQAKVDLQTSVRIENDIYNVLK
jgi:hypothetical protein